MSPRLIALIYFSLRSVVSSSNSPCWIPLKVIDKLQSVYLGHFYFNSTKTTQRTDVSLFCDCDLSIGRVCLGTNVAVSNRRQGRSHVDEDQELKPTSSQLLLFSMTLTSAFFKASAKVISLLHLGDVNCNFHSEESLPFQIFL